MISGEVLKADIYSLKNRAKCRFLLHWVRRGSEFFQVLTFFFGYAGSIYFKSEGKASMKKKVKPRTRA